MRVKDSQICFFNEIFTEQQLIDVEHHKKIDALARKHLIELAVLYVGTSEEVYQLQFLPIRTEPYRECPKLFKRIWRISIMRLYDED